MLDLLSKIVLDPQAKTFISESKILNSESEKLILNLFKGKYDKNIKKFY